MGMNELVDCPICDQAHHQMFVPDKQNAFWGRLVTCPLCGGGGRIDGVRWVAYRLLSAGRTPTYDEINQMVADLHAMEQSHRFACVK